MKKALLDTNIIVAFLKGNPPIVEKLALYINEHSTFTISIISYYEILRGLKSIESKKKLQMFKRFISDCEIEELGMSVIEKATDIYAELRIRGALIEDADILIAATAMDKGFTLVTDNEKHFRRITGLEVENWLK